jgi:phospholipid/cholesterol/gamma-HCH transport system substrate-binding protein
VKPKENRRQDVWLGLFVLAALAVLITGSLWIAGSTLLGPPRILYRVRLPDSAGVEAGDRVRFAGVAVGRVSSVRLREDRDWPVAVQISIRPEVVLHEDSTASIASSSLLGSAFLQLEAGTPGSPRLPEGAEILGRPPGGIDAALARAEEVAAKTSDLIGRTADVIDSFSVQLSSLTSRAERALSDENVENLGLLLSSLRESVDSSAPRMAELFENLERMSGHLDESAEELPDLTRRLGTILAGLEQAFGADGERLGGLLDTAEGSLAAARDSLEMLGGNREQIEDLVRDFAETAANLKSLSQQLKERPYSLVRVKPLPERKPGDGLAEGSR